MKCQMLGGGSEEVAQCTLAKYKITNDEFN